MCGIAGHYFHDEGVHTESISAGLARQMKAMKHRGPNAQGKVVYPMCGLGMTRLSIVDLESGSQPIFSADGRFSIVFNGEIYNYITLREQLVARGVSFDTSSDTEVLLQGYLLYGAAFLAQLEGMFAFVIYDLHQHELFVARDRLGKKPFYYYNDGKRFLFASEAQALTPALGVMLNVSNQSYWDYLTFRYVPGSNSGLCGIMKLPAGHFMRITRQSTEPVIECYWRFPNVALGVSIIDPYSAFGEHFARAVKLRLVADVPIGVVLSGGIDSAAVLYEARKAQVIDSYHVYFNEGDNYNELRYARLTAKHLGSKLHVIEVTESDFICTLDKLATITDEPLADLASVPFKHVCDLASRDVKVVLSGEGSDEILGGYDLHFLKRNFLVMDFLNAFPKAREMIMALCPESARSRFVRLEGTSKTWAARNNFNPTFQASQEMKTHYLAQGVALLRDSALVLQAKYAEVAELDPINQILRVLSDNWLVENVLMKSDKVAMSSSLEVRCPFLDHRLVEFVSSLPGSVKVGWRQGRIESKVLLRGYMAGKIPDEIITRKKLGFPVPAYILQSKRYRDYLFDTLSADNRYYEGMFDRKKILALFDSEIPGVETDAKHFLWSIALFERWYENHKMVMAHA